MVEEKLPKEIEAKRAIVAKLSKVIDMPAIDKKDIEELQKEVCIITQFRVIRRMSSFSNSSYHY